MLVYAILVTTYGDLKPLSRFGKLVYKFYFFWFF